jgi:hypothetical protein
MSGSDRLFWGCLVGVVVVDWRYDIQIINLMAMRLLDIFTEPMAQDLIHLARSIPSEALKQAIDAAFRRELWPLPRQQQTLTALATFATTGAPEDLLASLKGVVTVETLLGERRSLHFTCCPFVGSPVGSPPATATTQEAVAQRDVRAGTTSAVGDSAVDQERAASGPLPVCQLRMSSSNAIARFFKLQIVLSWTCSTILPSLQLALSHHRVRSGLTAQQAAATPYGAVVSRCRVLLAL